MAGPLDRKSAMTEPPILVGRHKAAEILGVHPATVYRWTNTGLLPAIELPSGTRRYEVDALLKLRASKVPVERAKKD